LVLDLTVGHAEPDQLRARDDAFLASGEFRDTWQRKAMVPGRHVVSVRA